MVSVCFLSFFFFNDTATTEIYTLSLHDALPISGHAGVGDGHHAQSRVLDLRLDRGGDDLADAHRELAGAGRVGHRSEEHTSELQSRQYLVCRLLLEKKNSNTTHQRVHAAFIHPR